LLSATGYQNHRRPAGYLAKYRITYFIVGAAHPHVKRHEANPTGCRCNGWLKKGVLVTYLLQPICQFEELVEFIGAPDIYITPYLNPAQIVSGTLAYTLGAESVIDPVVCRRDAG
jgi:hypothetical protein